MISEGARILLPSGKQLDVREPDAWDWINDGLANDELRIQLGHTDGALRHAMAKLTAADASIEDS